MSVNELPKLLDVPSATVEDWVYKGVVPNLANLNTLNNFIAAVCVHHWVIETSNGQC